MTKKKLTIIVAAVVVVLLLVAFATGTFDGLFVKAPTVADEPVVEATNSDVTEPDITSDLNAATGDSGEDLDYDENDLTDDLAPDPAEIPDEPAPEVKAEETKQDAEPTTQNTSDGSTGRVNVNGQMCRSFPAGTDLSTIKGEPFEIIVVGGVEYDDIDGSGTNWHAFDNTYQENQYTEIGGLSGVLIGE